MTAITAITAIGTRASQVWPVLKKLKEKKSANTSLTLFATNQHKFNSDCNNKKNPIATLYLQLVIISPFMLAHYVQARLKLPLWYYYSQYRSTITAIVVLLIVISTILLLIVRYIIITTLIFPSFFWRKNTHTCGEI